MGHQLQNDIANYWHGALCSRVSHHCRPLWTDIVWTTCLFACSMNLFSLLHIQHFVCGGGCFKWVRLSMTNHWCIGEADRTKCEWLSSYHSECHTHSLFSFFSPPIVLFNSISGNWLLFIYSVPQSGTCWYFVKLPSESLYVLSLSHIHMLFEQLWFVLCMFMCHCHVTVASVSFFCFF